MLNVGKLGLKFGVGFYSTVAYDAQASYFHCVKTTVHVWFACRWFYLCSYCFVWLGMFLTMMWYPRFKDYNKMNNELLNDIKRQNNVLQELLKEHGNAGPNSSKTIEVPESLNAVSRFTFILSTAAVIIFHLRKEMYLFLNGKRKAWVGAKNAARFYWEFLTLSSKSNLCLGFNQQYSRWPLLWFVVRRRCPSQMDLMTARSLWYHLPPLEDKIFCWILCPVLLLFLVCTHCKIVLAVKTLLFEQFGHLHVLQ